MQNYFKYKLKLHLEVQGQTLPTDQAPLTQCPHLELGYPRGIIVVLLQDMKGTHEFTYRISHVIKLLNVEVV